MKPAPTAGDRGGIFLAFEDLGRMFDHSFPAWRFANAHKIQSLRQNQSTVAQRAETTVAECPLTFGVG